MDFTDLELPAWKGRINLFCLYYDGSAHIMLKHIDRLENASGGNNGKIAIFSEENGH